MGAIRIGCQRRILGVNTPAIYRIVTTHLRRAPVDHYFEHRGYGWLVDIDDLPRLPRWLAWLVRFDATDHLDVRAFLARHRAALPGGRTVALLQARVLGCAFNPVDLYWCHDRFGALRHVVVDMHNVRGGRHSYLLPPADLPVLARKAFAMSPFAPLDGHYVIQAPVPAETLEVSATYHRDGVSPFVATVRGSRRKATLAQVIWLQLTVPAAPLVARLVVRWQHVLLRLRGLSEASANVVRLERVSPSSRPDRQVHDERRRCG
jgi:uncharacterized protein